MVIIPTHKTKTFKSVVDTLGEVTELLFTGGPSALIHNSSFWTTFFHSLMFDMSSGRDLVDIRRVRQKFARNSYLLS